MVKVITVLFVIILLGGYSLVLADEIKGLGERTVDEMFEPTPIIDKHKAAKNVIRIANAKYGNTHYTYGVENGYVNYFCNATGQLKTKCDGKKKCKIIVGSNICGDPYPGKGKYLFIEYFCGNKLKKVRKDQTEVVLLKCP